MLGADRWRSPPAGERRPGWRRTGGAGARVVVGRCRSIAGIECAAMEQDRDDAARQRDREAKRRDLRAAVRDRAAGTDIPDAERRAREEAAADRRAAAEDRRASAEEREGPDRPAAPPPLRLVRHDERPPA